MHFVQLAMIFGFATSALAWKCDLPGDDWPYGRCYDETGKYTTAFQCLKDCPCPTTGDGCVPDQMTTSYTAWCTPPDYCQLRPPFQALGE
ncbi:unnamed protein product [Zymoseptoria tritici ST99CH_3D1]|nr:unnamed protein product [Zymoseptoria tritici ST99CH_3D1]